MSILNNIEKQRISIEKFNAYTYFGAAKHIAEWAVRKMGVKLGSY